ncbi:MAG TPA: tetratricopeptide repeat protein [Candidatus Brocadiia bacterium]|nr:tetratricopeptide repeat protein [Candidatus Brocadiia bacterium]
MAKPKSRKDYAALLHAATQRAAARDFVGVVRILAPSFNRRSPDHDTGALLARAYYNLGNTAMALEVAEILHDRFHPDPHILFLKGIILESQGHGEAAADAYREALEAAPGLDEARLNLAELSLRLSDISQARRWTRDAGLPEGVNPRLHLLRGLALKADGLLAEALREVQLAHDAGLDDPRIQPALEDLRKSVAEQEEHLREISEFAQEGPGRLPPGLDHAGFAEDYVTCLMNLGRRAEALRYADEAAERFPANPGILSIRARVLLDSGRCEEAILLAGRVAELEGDTSFSDWALRQAEGLAGAPEERLSDYLARAENAEPATRAELLANAALIGDLPAGAEASASLAARAVAADPNSQAAAVAAALVAQRAGDYAGAAASFRRCVARWPSASTWSQLGASLLAMGDKAEAARAFRRALELGPDFDIPHVHLASLACAEGDLDRAARECRLALDANPNSVPARRTLVECYLRLGRYDDAEDLCHELLDLPSANAAEIYRTLGNIWELRGDIERAIERYSEAISEGDASPRLLLDIGRLYANHGQFADADVFFKRARALAPKDGAVLDTMAQAAIIQGRVAQGLRLLRQAVKIDPGAFEPLLHLGQAYYQEGRFEEASRELEKALALRPYSADGHAMLATVRLEMGDYKGALACYRGGLKCDPEHFELLAGLAEMHFIPPRGRWVTAGEAVARLRAALGRAPSNDAVLHVLSRLNAVEPLASAPAEPPPPQPSNAPGQRSPLWPAPDFAEMLRSQLARQRSETVDAWIGGPMQDSRVLTRAIQIGPASADLFAQRATASAILGRFEDALLDLSEAILLSPQQGSLFLQRAKTRAALGDLEAALADANRAVELLPGDAAVLETRGQLLAALGRRRDAAADFTSAIAADPSRHTSFWGRARALIEMGQPGLAADDLTAALALRPSDPALLVDRGECRFRCGDLEGAVADFSAALERDPRCGLALENRARVLLALGRGPQARADVEAALVLRPGDPQLLALRARLS